MHGNSVEPVPYSLGVEPAVNISALEALAGQQRGLDRPMAFAILDGQLCRLAKAQGVLDLYVGKALAPLLGGGYEALGYARLADYCIEQLSCTRRAAELLRQQADQMDRFPVVRQAFLDATLNQSHARVLLAHLEHFGGDERELVSLSRSLTVRGLKEALGVLVVDTNASRPEPGAAGGSAGEEGGEDALGGSDVGPSVDRSFDPAQAARRDAADAAGEAPQPDGAWRYYRVGAELLAEWEQIAERCARTESRQLQPWEVLEILASRFLEGQPAALSQDLGMPPCGTPAAMPGASGPELPQDGSGSAPGLVESAGRLGRAPSGTGDGGPGSRWDLQRSGPPFDWRKFLEESSDCWRWLDDLPVRVDVDGELAMPAPEAPLEAHELVCRLMLCRRRLGLYLGRMLRTLDNAGLVRRAEFAGMSHYSAERLGLGASTTSRLLRREQGLVRRQLLFDAIAGGRIGVTQADLLLQLPEIVPDDQWIAWAAVRTSRALEDAVQDFNLVATLDREFVRQRGWHPPAEGEDLQAIVVALQAKTGVPASPIPGSGVVVGAKPVGSQTGGREAGNDSGMLPMFSQQGGPSGEVSMFSQQGGPSGGLSMFSQQGDPSGDLSMFSQQGGPSGELSMFSQRGDPSGGLSMFSQRGDPAGVPSLSQAHALPSQSHGPGLRIFVPNDSLPVILEAEAAASRAAGRPLSPEEFLRVMVVGFQATYTEFERKLQAQRRRALRRARYRCQAPGCRSRRGLHVHHVIFRSQGGSNDDSNLVVLCPCHHLRGVHGGKMRVSGSGPALRFEIGIEGGRPFMVFHGDVRVA